MSCTLGDETTEKMFELSQFFNSVKIADTELALLIPFIVLLTGSNFHFEAKKFCQF